ncbi:MAG: purine-binding chemotaxis protein CheW [Lachnospiraceae bacterium]|nr:purine-binding chemotaxis protein CheW [Lachnospiraceae bacterium]MBR5179131.1 purine-binding chemotaxis protein CheW [Lachnospiraceae bacterium]
MADIAEAGSIDQIKQYIDVMINNEQYGIDISYIDNIIRMQRITRVPKAQEYFPGVINLRGEIIPVMSLRRRFGFEDDVFTPKTRILILKPEPQASIGFIVDEVREVITLKEEEIDRVVTSEDKNTYITGIGKHTKGLISVLNVAAVLQEKEKGE